MLIVASSNAEKITDADIEAINQLGPKILEKSAKEKFYEAVKREIEDAERDYLAGKIRSYTPKEAMEEMDRWSKDGM